jgi:hypothetical protein
VQYPDTSLVLAVAAHGTVTDRFPGTEVPFQGVEPTEAKGALPEGIVLPPYTAVETLFRAVVVQFVIGAGSPELMSKT